MELSIVTTMYHSAPFLPEFYERVKKAAEAITSDYEIIFVNDGSPDNSLEVAVGLYEKDEKVRVVDFSRNFGHHKAMMTGVEHAKGDLVFLIDCDLEEPPELLAQFHEHLNKTGSDMVFGVQAKRAGTWFKRFTGYVYFKVMNWISYHPLPVNIITARLMTKRYVKSLVQHRDQEVFILGLWTITGYKQTAIPVVKASKDTSTYSIAKRVSAFANSITSFSNSPLNFIFYLGCVILMIAIVYSAYLFLRKIFFSIPVTGWTSVIISIWFLGGLIIFCIGIIGIYLSKIFMEVKPRPYTIIRNIYERNPSSFDRSDY